MSHHCFRTDGRRPVALTAFGLLTVAMVAGSGVASAPAQAAPAATLAAPTQDRSIGPGQVPWLGWQPQGESSEPGTLPGGAVDDGTSRAQILGWTPSTFTASMRRNLNSTAAQPLLRGRTSVMVAAADGTPQWSLYSGRSRMPASTQKLITAFNALSVLPPTRRLTTDVRVAPGDTQNIYLVGGGDPTLSWARLVRLADATAAKLKAAGMTRVGVYLDDTLFPAPSLAPGWKWSYLRSDVQRVRALTYAGYRGTSGAVKVAQDFSALLAKRGISIRNTLHKPQPAGTALMAQTSSATVEDLVQLMLNVSQNDFAEYLNRHVALAVGKTPSWAGARSAAGIVLGRAGVPLRGYAGYDGSGLSRSNRMPVATLTSVLSKMYANPTMQRIAFAADGVPRSGQTGTLRNRFKASTTSCARGKVWAKTGTLNDVVGLAGIVHSVDGHKRVMVLLENGSYNASGVRAAMDQVATSVVGCRLRPPSDPAPTPTPTPTATPTPVPPEQLPAPDFPAPGVNSTDARVVRHMFAAASRITN